tara:strand:+ start:704 stop:892 length:189 start_codon:yes stop_codon:yes gene_type:complete
MKKFLIMFFILIFHSQALSNESQDSKVNNNISDQLKILKDQYELGTLSGYEYEKEKKKILNQ